MELVQGRVSEVILKKGVIIVKQDKEQQLIIALEGGCGPTRNGTFRVSDKETVSK